VELLEKLGDRPTRKVLILTDGATERVPVGAQPPERGGAPVREASAYDVLNAGSS
jgi:hypothetical protein